MSNLTRFQCGIADIQAYAKKIHEFRNQTLDKDLELIKIKMQIIAMTVSIFMPAGAREMFVEFLSATKKSLRFDALSSAKS